MVAPVFLQGWRRVYRQTIDTRRFLWHNLPRNSSWGGNAMKGILTLAFALLPFFASAQQQPVPVLLSTQWHAAVVACNEEKNRCWIYRTNGLTPHVSSDTIAVARCEAEYRKLEGLEKTSCSSIMVADRCVYIGFTRPVPGEYLTPADRVPTGYGYTREEAERDCGTSGKTCASFHAIGCSDQ
jgi:hypothetical protein